MFSWFSKKNQPEENKIEEKHQVYFLSCRVREMNTDLVPVFDALKAQEETSVFSFIRDNNKSMLPEEGIPMFSFPISELSEEEISDSPDEKKTFASICNDIALRELCPERTDDARQILLITANNFYYQLFFKEIPEADDPKRLDLEKFSHILAPNPFIYQLISEHYTLDDTQTLELMENPYHWNLRQEEQINAHQTDFLARYPQAVGKKILFLMLPKKTSKEIKESFETFPLDDFLNSLSEEWFLVTNYKPLLMRTMGMRKDYTGQFLYLDQQFPLEDILYFCDLLLTDLSFMAVAQAQRNKPFFCLGHNDNAFEQYIKENHPTLFLETLDDLLSFEQIPCEITEEHLSLYEELTYHQEESPLDTLKKLLLFE